MFKHEDLQIVAYKLNKCMNIFHPPEVVGRGSETQLRVDDNYAMITWWEEMLNG